VFALHLILHLTPHSEWSHAATSDVRDMKSPIARVQSATLAGRTSHLL